MSEKINVRRWSPTGESKVFATESGVPAGWTDSHPGSGTPTPKPSAAPPPTPDMSRETIIAALEGGGIAFKKTAGTAALYALLTENVKLALTEKKIAFDPNAKTSTLLALLSPAE